MTIIKTFFSNLHWRFNKENDLSDLTWAMCQTSETFKQLFLQFFFPNTKFDKINSFLRERVQDDSRADFVIDNDGELYVVECKIGDRNHHFEQYLEAYNIEAGRLGYIVNYNHSYKDFEIKTWRQFYKFIEDNLAENEDEKTLYQGYLAYLQNICGIIKITKKMKLSGAYSLYCFNQILKSVINRNTENFTLSYYNTDFKESYYGYKFKVSAPNKDDIWLSVGLWFNFEKPVITIGVWKLEGWGKPFSDELEKGKRHIEKYAGQHYWENNSFYFEGTEKFYKEFEDAINVEIQKDVLCKFVDEVVDFYVKPEVGNR
ncbi:MAG: hypothetical protein QM654_07020 [Dysgonamonadaceae bacterium]